LPLLRGIGGNLTCPIGVSMVNVEVQGLRERIEMYIVDDYVLSHPASLGHSFTEKQDIVITKTPDEIIFQRLTLHRVHLVAEKGNKNK
jgi:hypothetical protein